MRRMDSQREPTGAQSVVADATLADSAPAVSAQEQALLEALERAEAGVTSEPSRETTGEEYLLVWLGGSPYLVRLSELREALPAAPQRAALPFSPRWMWGIFPLRTDLVALVDPMPTLLYGPEAARNDLAGIDAARAAPRHDMRQAEEPRALVVGEGERMLALLVDSIGDICLLQPDDERLPELSAEEGAGPLPRYVATRFSMPDMERAVVALRTAPLIDDIFAALEERSDHE